MIFLTTLSHLLWFRKTSYLCTVKTTKLSYKGMEDMTLKALKCRVNEYLKYDDPIDAIASVEDELDDIVEQIFNEYDGGLNVAMEGNAQILHATKYGYMIKTDEGELMALPEKSYKGSSTERGTRVLCGRFYQNKLGKQTCIDAQECLSMNDLKYLMFSSIEDWDMVTAASAAWAIYRNASPLNQEKMKYCIHKLRNYIKRARVRTAC